MNSQQESIQKAFREEQDARFQNQGEVSILRKRMEKVCIEINCNHLPPAAEGPFQLMLRLCSSRRNTARV